MKGDFTRFTHNPRKHYSQVLKQQGRPELDADWNEHGAIAKHLTAEAYRDVIGRAGFVKGDSFKVAPNADATDLVIQPGHAYVDGIPAVFEGTDPVSYRAQPDYVPLPPLVPVENQVDLVYLDVWERHITAVEDEEIREPALGGIDPTTRVKVIAQVKIEPNVATTNCEAALAKISRRPGGGRLTTKTAGGDTTPASCLLPATGGYRGLENRLYRVEIHQEGDLNGATFKWSRDNGGVVFPVAAFLGPKLIELSRLGRDQILTVKEEQWVEVLGDQTELKGESGTLAKVVHLDPHTRKLELSVDVSAHATETHPKIRRWDMAAGAIRTNNPVTLEDGIQVEFSLAGPAEKFRAGDYWTFTARTGSAGLQKLDKAPPQGITHHFAALCLLPWKKTGGKFEAQPEDCRKQFPPLTAIAASDVSFNNTVCDFPAAATVQEALEALCRRSCCALVAQPGPGWQQVFDKLPPEGGMICFRPGEYSLTTTVEVRGKGPIVLAGAGEASKIAVSSAECAIRFVDCGSITIRDLAARAQTTGRGARGTGPNDGIRGVFDFANCFSVSFQNVVLTCAGGPERAAACLSVHGNAQRNFEVRVTGCRLKVGANQDGMVILNPSRVFISDNTIEGTRVRVNALPESLVHPVSRSELRKPLLSKLFVKQSVAPGVKPNLEFPAGNAFIRFVTLPSLVAPWQALLAQARLRPERPAVELRDKVLALANRLLRDNDVAAFQPVVNQIRDAQIGSGQAIVIGGLRAEQVRIEGNVIADFVQGIHVGLSKSGPRTGGNVQRAGRVQITGNSVTLWIGPGVFRERHGIFAGNADSILVGANTLALLRDGLSASLLVDGIRVFGYLGRYVMLRDNHIPGFGVGIRVTPRGTEYTAGTRFWRAEDNAILFPTQQAIVGPVVVG